MKKSSKIIGALVAGGLMSGALAPRASAAITDEQFNQLKDLVTQQGQDIQKQDQRIDQLEKIHDQDQKTHDQDQQKIRDLEKQLDETHSIATNAAQTAEAAAQAQPAAPAGPPASHNFSMVGDAEFQFGKDRLFAQHVYHGGFRAHLSLSGPGRISSLRRVSMCMLQNGQQQTVGGGGSSTSVNMSFGTIDYLLNDYATLEAGDMLLAPGHLFASAARAGSTRFRTIRCRANSCQAAAWARNCAVRFPSARTDPWSLIRCME